MKLLSRQTRSSSKHPNYQRRFLITSNLIRNFSRNTFYRMKSLLALTILSLLAFCSAFPQREGAFFTNEAIRQAQNTQLIPAGAHIQKVQEGVEVAAYESIPGNERINLYQILKDHVPEEVVSNLQSQVDQVGKS